MDVDSRSADQRFAKFAETFPKSDEAQNSTEIEFLSQHMMIGWSTGLNGSREHENFRCCDAGCIFKHHLLTRDPDAALKVAVEEKVRITTSEAVELV